MTTNFIQPGEVIDHTPGSAVSSGDVVVMGVRVGIALADIEAGAVGAVQVSGVFELPKLSTDVIAQGALVYWDTTPGEITVVVGSNVVAGYAVAAAGNGVTTCKVKLNA
jgi:predicted RecA/RadA family phage recombinase